MAFPPKLDSIFEKVANKTIASVQNTAINKVNQAISGIIPGVIKGKAVPTKANSLNNAPVLYDDDRNFIQSEVYKVTITAEQDLDKPITAWMPQNIEVPFSSGYDTPFESALDNLTNNAFGNATRAFGYAPLTQFLTTQVWKGTSHVQITLNLQFLADSDPFNEVMVPIAQLTSLVLPYEYESAPGLIAPGGSATLGSDSVEKLQKQFEDVIKNRQTIIDDISSGVQGSVQSPIKEVQTNLVNATDPVKRVAETDGVSTGFGSNGVFGSVTNTSKSVAFRSANEAVGLVQQQINNSVSGLQQQIGKFSGAVFDNIITGKDGSNPSLKINLSYGNDPSQKEGQTEAVNNKQDFTANVRTSDPSRKNSMTNSSRKNIITISIGKYLTFKDVLIESVRPTFDNVLSSRDGRPIKADVQVTFTTSVIPVRNALSEIFNMKNFSEDGSSTGVPGVKRGAV